MSRSSKSDMGFLFSYFIIIALIGMFFLRLPVSAADGNPVPLIDAAFTAVSAVCVTGLVTIPTSAYSQFGQIVIMSLIQLGGLGIISFSTILIILPGLRFSLTRLKFVNNYYISEIEHDPKKIVKAIILGTLILQTIGILVLFWRFTAAGIEQAFFSAVFHTISAFCNAGFSIYDDSLMAFSGHPDILLPVSTLFILGGLSFIVIHELIGRFHARKRKRYTLSLHSKIVLGTTGILLTLGTIAFLVLEWQHLLSEMSWNEKLVNAFFQAATPRTAGFNAISQESLQPPSIMIIMLLMLIGGAPGSIAGGIKVTTFAVMIMVIFQGYTSRGHIHIFKREVDKFTIINAFAFGIKALALLLTAIIALTLSESQSLANESFQLIQVIFEAFSAFGTVGLSLGITGDLSTAGKIIIIFTMLAGRVGLVSLAVPFFNRSSEDLVRLPRGEVLLG